MAKVATRTKFQSLEPITSRPEEQVAARVQARRAATAVRERAPRTKLGVAILVIATIGLIIAIYTTVVHYVGFGALLCAGGSASHSSCEQVQSSPYNNVAGIPVSVLGLVGYFVILSGLRVRGELARAAVFGTALVGFLFSMYLTYREAFTLHEYCEWCLGSAACMTVLVVLTAVRYLRAQPGS